MLHSATSARIAPAVNGGRARVGTLDNNLLDTNWNSNASLPQASD